MISSKKKRTRNNFNSEIKNISPRKYKRSKKENVLEYDEYKFGRKKLENILEIEKLPDDTIELLNKYIIIGTVNSQIKELLLKDNYKGQFVNLAKKYKNESFIIDYIQNILIFLINYGNVYYNYKDQFTNNVDTIIYWLINNEKINKFSDKDIKIFKNFVHLEKFLTIKLDDLYNKIQNEWNESYMYKIYYITGLINPLKYRVIYLKNYIEEYEYIHSQLTIDSEREKKNKEDIIYSKNIFEDFNFNRLVEYGRLKLDSNVFKNIKSELEEEITELNKLKDDKMMLGGVFIKDGIDEGDKNNELDLKIYTILRTSDSIHDFYKERGNLIDNKKLYVKNIKFKNDKITKTANDVYEEISNKYRLNTLFQYLDENPGPFDEPRVIEQLNIYLKDNLLDKDDYYSRFRIDSDYLKKNIKELFEPYSKNQCKKYSTLNPEKIKIKGKEIYCITRFNLDTITDTEKENIYDEVKSFIGEKNEISIDMTNSTKKFFKLLNDVSIKKGPIFSKKEMKDIYAELWDSAGAGFKSIKEYENLITLKSGKMKLNVSLLNESVDICKNFTIKLGDDGAIFSKKFADDSLKKYDTLGIKSRSVGNLSSLIPLHADIDKENHANDDEVCIPFYIKNSGDWGQIKNAKENKIYLVTDDSLASYYSILTKTSTITTFSYEGDLYTIIYKYGLESTLREYLNKIKIQIDNLFFKKHYNSVSISTNGKQIVTYKVESDKNLLIENIPKDVIVDKIYNMYKDTVVTIIKKDNSVISFKEKDEKEDLHTIFSNGYININKKILNDIFDKLLDDDVLNKSIETLVRNCEKKDEMIKIINKSNIKESLVKTLRKYLETNYEGEFNSGNPIKVENLQEHIKNILQELVDENYLDVVHLYYKLDDRNIKIDSVEYNNFKDKFNYDSIKEFEPEKTEFDIIFKQTNRDKLVESLKKIDIKVFGITGSQYKDIEKNLFIFINSTKSTDLKKKLIDLKTLLDDIVIESKVDEIKKKIVELSKEIIRDHGKEELEKKTPSKKKKITNKTQKLSDLLNIYTNLDNLEAIKNIKQNELIQKFKNYFWLDNEIPSRFSFEPNQKIEGGGIDVSELKNILDASIISEGLWDTVYYNPQFLSLWFRYLLKDSTVKNVFIIDDGMLFSFNTGDLQEKKQRQDEHKRIATPFIEMIKNEKNVYPNEDKIFNPIISTVDRTKKVNNLELLYTNIYNIYSKNNTQLIDNLKKISFSFKDKDFNNDKLEQFSVIPIRLDNWNEFKRLINILNYHCENILKNEKYLSKYYFIYDYIMPLIGHLYKLIEAFRESIEYVEIKDIEDLRNHVIFRFNEKYRELLDKFNFIRSKSDLLEKYHDRLNNLIDVRTILPKRSDIDLIGDSFLKFACLYFDCKITSPKKEKLPLLIKTTVNMNVDIKKQVTKCNDINLPTFTFVSNSCYLDSILFALFSIPSELIKGLKSDTMNFNSYHVDDKEEFHKNISFLIRNKDEYSIEKLNRVRNYIRSNIKDSKNRSFWDDSTQEDAEEFLGSFCQIYNIKYEPSTLPLHTIVDSSDLLINRLNMSDDYELVEKYENDNKNKVLTHVLCYLGDRSDLTGGVIGHYIVWFKCNDVWHKYDNLNNDLITLGSTERPPEIKKKGYLFFYRNTTGMVLTGGMTSNNFTKYEKELLSDLSKYNISNINKNKLTYYVHLLKKRDEYINYINKINMLIEKEVLKKHSESLLSIKNKMENYKILLTRKEKLLEYYVNLESNIEYVKKSLKKIK